MDDWGQEHVISETHWFMDLGAGTDSEYGYTITTYSNEDTWLVAQNDGLNPDGEADFWSRFDWTRDTDGKLYFCQTANLETSEAAAMAVTPADGDELEAGCPGFGWLGLSPG
jgi:hypothetical protein